MRKNREFKHPKLILVTEIIVAIVLIVALVFIVKQKFDDVKRWENEVNTGCYYPEL